VLGKLLHHPRTHEFRVSTLVRDTDKAEKLKVFSVTPVVGDLNLDLDLLEMLGKDVDVVFPIVCVSLVFSRRYFIDESVRIGG
jgi:uncharacterized protein YbjT (DUF2867 family)